MTREQTQQAILDILLAFDGYCRKQDIRYFLGFGTVLGAVRHKGFIPWDDDVDVILLRDQYEKFKNSVLRDRYLDKEKIYRVRIPGDENYAYSFTKVEDTRYLIRETNVADRFNGGLYIDVFVMDNWPENPLREWCQLRQLQLLLCLAKLGIRGNFESRGYRVLDVLLRPLDWALKGLGYRPEKVLRRIENFGTRNAEGNYVGNFCEANGSVRERMQRSFFDGVSKQYFEGRVFPCPGDLDGYLGRLYGDYMSLPPEDQRVGHEYNIICTPEEKTV